AAPLAAVSMRAATACGCDTYTEWLPLTSATVEPARLDIARWASGGIILSSVETRYQLGFVFHAGWLIAPLRASTPHGTCESAMNSARSGLTSAANDDANFALSRNSNPSCGGTIGGTGTRGRHPQRGSRRPRASCRLSRRCRLWRRFYRFHISGLHFFPMFRSV